MCRVVLWAAISYSATGGPSSQYEELYCVFFLLLCERSAKGDSRLAAYEGAMLQHLEGLN